MKLLLISVYDSAIEAYTRPFPVQTLGQATRSFTDECTRQDSEIGQHPQDYALFQVGEFNDHDGLVTPTTPPKCIAKAHEVIAFQKAKELEQNPEKQ